MLELDDESNIIKKLLVITEICSWLQTFRIRTSNPGGSQEILTAGPVRRAKPNFVPIGRTVAQTWPFFNFSRWRRPPSWIFKS